MSNARQQCARSRLKVKRQLTNVINKKLLSEDLKQFLESIEATWTHLKITRF